MNNATNFRTRRGFYKLGLWSQYSPRRQIATSRTDLVSLCISFSAGRQDQPTNVHERWRAYAWSTVHCRGSSPLFIFLWTNADQASAMHLIAHLRLNLRFKAPCCSLPGIAISTSTKITKFESAMLSLPWTNLYTLLPSLGPNVPGQIRFPVTWHESLLTLWLFRSETRPRCYSFHNLEDLGRTSLHDFHSVRSRLRWNFAWMDKRRVI